MLVVLEVLVEAVAVVAAVLILVAVAVLVVEVAVVLIELVATLCDDFVMGGTHILKLSLGEEAGQNQHPDWDGQQQHEGKGQCRR